MGPAYPKSPEGEEGRIVLGHPVQEQLYWCTRMRHVASQAAIRESASSHEHVSRNRSDQSGTPHQGSCSTLVSEASELWRVRKQLSLISRSVGRHSQIRPCPDEVLSWD